MTYTDFKVMGIDAKTHLEKYPMSIVEIRVEEHEMEKCKNTIAKVVGIQLFKRINFFPKYEE